MRTYEALYIIQPELGEDDTQTVATGVEKLITDDGGAIVRSEIWGKRRLAYEVKGFAEGVYVLVRFESNPTLIDQLKGSFRLNESIIRFLVVSFNLRALRLEIEQQKRSEAQAEARALSLQGRDSRGGRDDDDDRDERRPRPAPRAAVAPKEDAAPVAKEEDGSTEDAAPVSKTDDGSTEDAAPDSKADDGASEQEAAEPTKPVEA